MLPPPSSSLTPLCLDPYVQPKMDWWPIGISLSVVGVLLIVFFVLCGLAFLKSKLRTEQRLVRRDSLRRSLRASKQSIYANQHAIQRVDTAGTLVGGSFERLSERSASQKRRRPPMYKPDASSGVVDLSGVTLHDTDTDSLDKEKMYGARPGTPGADYGGSEYASTSSKPDVSSSYLDSDLHDFYPNRLENEITHIPAARSRHMDMVMRNEVFDDDRSMDRSRFNSASTASGMPYSSSSAGVDRYAARGNYSASSEVDLDDRPRRPTPRPKETAM